MQELLFWLYLVNAIFLINHEIDSAYWNEWKLFKIKDGISVFLLLHFPILFFVLYGLIQVFSQSFAGMIYSLILSIAGLFAFIIHMVFIKQDHKEFRTAISIFILCSILVISITQFIVTIIILNPY